METSSGAAALLSRVEIVVECMSPSGRGCETFSNWRAARPILARLATLPAARSRPRPLQGWDGAAAVLCGLEGADYLILVVSHREQAQWSSRHVPGSERLQCAAQIPARSHRQHRIGGGKLPVLTMNPAAQPPEAFAARKVFSTLLFPALGVVPQVHAR